MNQQPDKFFRTKVEGYTKSVPSSAWQKIEANLDKKNNTGVWWKVAAAILIVALGSYVLWPSPNIPAHQANAEIQNVDSIKSSTIEQHQSPIDNSKAIAVKPERKNPQGKSDNIEKKNEQSDNPTPVLQEPVSSDDRITVAQNTVAEQPVEEENLATVESENVVTQQPIALTSDTKSIKLVFRADDTDEYLNKKALAEATDNEETASTFKKLLKKAKGLKNNQDPFGELRQKKNEILALNFKNEKRGQNK